MFFGGLDQNLLSNMDTSLNLGLVNSLRTGNMIMDVMLCMCIPVLIKALMSVDMTFFKSLAETYFRFLSAKQYVRVISYTIGGSMRYQSWDSGSGETNHRNNILQKALRLYLQTKNIPLPDAEVFLTTTRKVHSSEFDEWGNNTFNSSYKQLLAYDATMLPSKGIWACVDWPQGLWFQQSVESSEENMGGRDNTRTVSSIVYTLKAYGSRAEKIVDNFVDESFRYYKELKKLEEDKSRYLFQCLKAKDSSGEDGVDAGFSYKKYVLSETKTFDCLFFPEKLSLLRLVDDFVHKRGKFAIQGFPDKLGLLLDGPPGTGKTSLIKALAQHTQRHIVTVNLDKISTNQELMDAMFDLVFPVSGGEEPLKFKFDQIVFVMEDVDCASSVVYARRGNKKPNAAKAAQDKGQTQMKMLRSISIEECPEKKKQRNEHESPFKGAVEELTEGATEDEDVEDHPEDLEKAAMMQIMQSMMAGKDDDKKPGEMRVDGKFIGPSFGSPSSDRLSLSGLLNVLDGVVDSPGRILVMTTNHPEKLDPALIRPGRINKRLHLNYIKSGALCDMISHYLQTEVSQVERTQAEELVTVHDLSPAQVEQACAEVDNVPDILHLLRNM